MNRGKLLILLMIAAGVGAGTLKVWRHHRHMQHVLESLSPRVVQLIAEASQAEVLRLTLVSPTENAAGETLEIEGQTYRIAGRKSVIGSQGLAEVRDRLVDDASYRWNVLLEFSAVPWQYMLQFTEGDQRARLAFDIPDGGHGVLMLLDSGPKLVIDPIADGLATFFTAQFEKSKPAR